MPREGDLNDRTGQVWRTARDGVFLVLGPKTITTQYNSDTWWYVFFMDGEYAGAEDVIFEASDRVWEQRTSFKRVT